MWIRLEQLIELGVSRATIFRKIAAKEWESQDGKETTGKGRPAKEILLESLPADLQLKYARREAEQRESADDAIIEAESTAPDSDDDRMTKFVAALSRFSPPDYTLEQKDAVQRRCLEMAKLCDEAIALISKLKATTGISVTSPGAREAGPGRAYHPKLQALAKRTASTDALYLEMYPSASKPLSVSTLLRLIDKYGKSGLSSFIRQTQTLSPSADERFLNVPQEATNWLQANLKNYVKGSITLYGENWLAWAKRHKVELPFVEHRPARPGTCYNWLYRWVKQVPNASLVLAREGQRGFEAKYAVITRHYDELRPRVGVTMDWRTSDVPCWLPFKKDKSKKPVLVRQVVCTVLDLKSRAVFGYRIDNRPSARGVTLAYLDAITYSDWKREAGFEMLYGMQRGTQTIEAFALWDNGKDFRAKLVEGEEIKVGKIDLEAGLLGVLESYKVGLAVDAQIKIRHAKPYNAKSKIVEPFHRYGIGLAEEGMPGYCGKNPTDKPHYYAAALRIHKAFMDGDAAKPADLRQLPSIWRDTYERYKEQYGYGTPFLSEADFRDSHRQLMIRYNQKPHGSLANERGELSPVEYVNLYADAPHVMSEKTVAALMMEARVVTVVADRVPLNWYGERFFYQEVSSDLSDGTALLRIPEKTKVEVRFNPDDIGRALILTQGAAMCWVVCNELLGWNATREDFHRAFARKKQAKKVADELYDVHVESTDWRDVIEERLPKALPKAVNAPDEYESPDEENAPTPTQPLKPVTVMTRFDRKSSDAPTRPAEVSHLRVVPDAQQSSDWKDDLKTFDDSPADDDNDWNDF